MIFVFLEYFKNFLVDLCPIKPCNNGSECLFSKYCIICRRTIKWIQTEIEILDGGHQWLILKTVLHPTPIFRALCWSFTPQKSFSKIVRRGEIVWRRGWTSLWNQPHNENRVPARVLCLDDNSWYFQTLN